MYWIVISTMSDTKPYCPSKPQPHITPREQPLPHRVGWEPHQRVDVSRANIPAAEILLAAYCQPVTTALYWKKYIRGQYPVVLTISEFANWSAVSRIRTSVLRRRGSKAFLLALHDKDKSFVIKSGTVWLRLHDLNQSEWSIVCVLLYSFLYRGKCSFHSKATFTNNSHIPSP